MWNLKQKVGSIFIGNWKLKGLSISQLERSDWDNITAAQGKFYFTHQKTLQKCKTALTSQYQTNFCLFVFVFLSFPCFVLLSFVFIFLSLSFCLFILPFKCAKNSNTTTSHPHKGEYKGARAAKKGNVYQTIINYSEQILRNLIRSKLHW